jgi:hypothetical protein
MARGYTVATVALALGTSAKWVDNLLSHRSIPGVAQSRQGVARRISFDAVVVLSLVGRLSEAFHIPVDAAVVGALALASGGEWSVDGGLAVTMNREAALTDLHSRLEYAVEAAPQPRRGRPPAKAKRGA